MRRTGGSTLMRALGVARPAGTAWAGRQRRGFTVIELATVITTAGILMALAIWRIGPALERARARQAVSVVASDLQYAQMIAARQREPVVVLVNPSLKALIIRSRSGLVFRERFVGPGTEFGLDTLSASPSTSVEIFPNGVATQTITFVAGRSGYRREVRLSRAGQIRVLAP